MLRNNIERERGRGVYCISHISYRAVLDKEKRFLIANVSAILQLVAGIGDSRFFSGKYDIVLGLCRKKEKFDIFSRMLPKNGRILKISGKPAVI